MELKTTPAKLKNIIEAGMLPSTAKPLFDPLVLICQPTQILNKQNHGNILVVYNTFTPGYLETYTPENEGSEVPISYLVLGRLKNDFGSTAVTLNVDKKTVNLDDGVNHFDRELDDYTAADFPIPMKKTEYGYAPEKFNPEFAALIDIKSLDLPDSSTYTFDFKAKKFIVSANKDGNFNRKLEVIKQFESKPIHKLVDPDYIHLVAKHLSGEVYIGFESNTVLLTKITKDDKGTELYTQTYMIATMSEGEK
jgi:hypothetical protein